MKHKALIKKLEKMFPEPVKVVHRPGACWLEMEIDHLSSYKNMIGECDEEHCWAKGSGKEWVKRRWCDEYKDCRKCQESRGLEFRQHFVAWTPEVIEESRKRQGNFSFCK